jgi:hypothetical protein
MVAVWLFSHASMLGGFDFLKFLEDGRLKKKLPIYPGCREKIGKWG